MVRLGDLESELKAKLVSRYAELYQICGTASIDEFEFKCRQISILSLKLKAMREKT